MTPLKPFQEATVEAAFRVLADERGERRFLVADEVGLGKTIVAQHLIKRMMEHRRTLNVFYVCSNLTIAKQNQRNLLKVLDRDERNEAACGVDRLTLLPGEDPPSHTRLRLYTLTPDTSIPMRQGKRRDGRQEERALIYALVEAIWPEVIKELKKSDFQRGVGDENWKALLRKQREKVGSRKSADLRRVFEAAARREFDLKEGQWLVRGIRDLLNANDDPLEIIAKFRNALAAGALESIHPDLVIFDEFQRFSDLTKDHSDSDQDESGLDRDEAAYRVIKQLQGGVGTGTALLLLSATPFNPYSRRWEDTDGRSHHKEFFDLIGFLYGGGRKSQAMRDKAIEAFSNLASEFYRGETDLARALKARRQVELILRPVMSRTERTTQPTDAFKYRPPVSAPIAEEDLKVFRHFTDCLHQEHRVEGASYWSSIPLPMQTMGSRYVLWEKANIRQEASDGIPALAKSGRNRFETMKKWPHPRLRAVMEVVPPRSLSVPWIAPSLPWWKLSGPWRQEQTALRSKVLVFSRFRAVPQAVAAALSYEMECRTLRGKGIKWEDVTKRRMLTATGERYPILALFHPSPFLSSKTDPLATEKDNFAVILESVRKQLIGGLKELDIPVQSASRPLPLWRIIARIDYAAGYGEAIENAWKEIYEENRQQRGEGGDDEENKRTGLGKLINEWKREAKEGLAFITPQELEQLAYFAVTAPGIVLARSLFRYWPEASGKKAYRSLLDATWNGLRTYLDQRWFMHSLGSNAKTYPRILQKAVANGNLEAVLDEYFWYLSKVQGLSGQEICDEVLSATRLHGGDVTFHELSGKVNTFSIRCHAALPFIDAKLRTYEGGQVVERPLRTDEMRKAFNSPFFPHVLITTSVGQEGLDFHPWCSSLVHWDLSNNPVDIEQREGRIQRYAGLSVRRKLTEIVGQKALHSARNKARSGLKTSPWSELEAEAEKYSDESGLAPWWSLPGADVDRFVLDTPTSEQRQRLSELKKQRLLYRLVLGQPNQEDLIETLGRKADLNSQEMMETVPRLSAWHAKGENS